MIKELQDHALACLPRELREEVKYEYKQVVTKARKDEYDLGFMHAHEGMFGVHNLTSDAEGEEICKNQKTYPKKKMNTELQNKVWSILPKEFKEEVNEIYLNAVVRHPCGYNHKTDLLKYLFGHHNLTSDAEGEEMLTVSRKEVCSIYDHAIGLITKTRTEDENYKLAILEKTLMEELFGSKCLLDVPSSESRDCDNLLAGKDGCRLCNDGKCTFNNACYFEPLNPQEPKSSEPKFKVGDKVRLKNVYEINEVDEDMARAGLKGCAYMEDFDNLEPYTEPTANDMQVDYHGADTAVSTHDTQLDKILINSFRDYNKLNIAAQIVAALYANHQAAKGFKSIEELVRKALDITDTLIKESEKGGVAD